MRIVSELPGLAGDRPVHRIGAADLCDLLGLTPAALTGLCKRDLAFRIGYDAYDLGATVHAYVKHLRGTASGRGNEAAVLTLTGERARLARAQAEGAELKNAERRGELVSADETVRAWATVLGDLRAELLALPSRLGAQMPHLTAADIAAISAELRASLEALADGH